jgi:hypothetical protein
MSVSQKNWSKTEEQIAYKALKKAYETEITSLMEYVANQSAKITQVDELWQLHDFLSAKRHQIDGKYDYSDPALIFVLAQLLQEGLLQTDDLEGLERDKLAKISSLAQIGF